MKYKHIYFDDTKRLRYLIRSLKKYNTVAYKQVIFKSRFIELEFKQIQLHGTDSLNPPKAYVCSIVGPPYTEFTYKLSDGIKEVISFFSDVIMKILYPKPQKRRCDLWTVLGVRYSGI